MSRALITYKTLCRKLSEGEMSWEDAQVLISAGLVKVPEGFNMQMASAETVDEEWRARHKDLFAEIMAQWGEAFDVGPKPIGFTYPRRRNS